MNKLLLSLFFVLISVQIQAQTHGSYDLSDVKKGDLFKIGNTDSQTFKHIKFPKTNFIIKKGGIANYTNIIGKEVVITSVKEDKQGAIIVNLKKSDGGRFFGSHNVVAANLEGALKSGELIPVE